MTSIPLTDFSWDRMIAAVEAVRERARRAAAALSGAGIEYVVIGGNAVAAWVARVDVEAVRNTKDVDVLLKRQDFDRAIEALAAVGFVHLPSQRPFIEQLLAEAVPLGDGSLLGSGFWRRFFGQQLGNPLIHAAQAFGQLVDDVLRQHVGGPALIFD